MRPPIWYFLPGTEDAVEVFHISHAAAGEGSVPLPESEQRWLVQCAACGIAFGLRSEHGIHVGADGALTTEHSLNCPKCGNWHVRFNGGVVQVL